MPVLTRPPRPRALISLVPMIDVMLILLVFFMVTSTYLDLDMIPAGARGDQPTNAPVAGPGDGSGGVGGTLLIRIGADGIPVLRGQPLDGAALAEQLSLRMAEAPLTRVLLLPSPAARTQALVSVMETASAAGVTRLQVVRLEASP